MKTFLGFIFGLLLSFQFLPSTYAGSYYDDLSGLSYSFAESYRLRDFTAEYNDVQPDALEAELYLLIGPDVEDSDEGIFEVSVSDSPLNVVLDELRLRIINTDSLENRDLLGTTAIEMIGSSYTNTEQRRALVFIHQGKTVVLLYKGSDLNEYEAFLRNVNQPSGVLDIIDHRFNREITDVMDRGIFNGYQNPQTGLREFAPDQPINRAEFLKVIVLAAPGVSQEMVDSFWRNFKSVLLQDDQDPNTAALLPDVDRDAWFAPYIFFAYDRAWVDGYPDGSFRPVAAINLAEASKMILNSRSTFLAPDLEVWFRPFMEYLDAKNVLVALGGDEYRFSFVGQSIFPYQNCSRGQAAAFLSRLLWLDEQDALDRYARQVLPDFFPFSLDLIPETQFYDLDRPVLHPDSRTTYQLYLPRGDELQFLLSIAVFSPEAWTNYERQSEQTGDLLSIRYLGENRHAVYVARKECVTPPTCSLPEKERDSLLNSFVMETQDLTRFQDQNASLRFLHAEPIDVDIQREQNVTTLNVARNDGWELATLSLVSDSLDAAEYYQATQPERVRRFGNRDWYLYPKNNDPKRLRLVTDFGVNNVLVIDVPGISSLSELDAKVQRMLRTVE